MVKYLKKVKFRKLLLSMGYPVPALKDCEWKFYRGSEWLRFTGVDGLSYECYLSGFMSVEFFEYNDLDERVSFHRDFYYADQVKVHLSELEV